MFGVVVQLFGTLPPTVGGARSLVVLAAQAVAVAVAVAVAAARLRHLQLGHFPLMRLQSQRSRFRRDRA
jgi:hypothetical protein